MRESERVSVTNWISKYPACESCPLRKQAQAEVEKSRRIKLLPHEKIIMGSCKSPQKLSWKYFLVKQAITTFWFLIASEPKLKFAEVGNGGFLAQSFPIQVPGICPKVIEQSVNRLFKRNTGNT